MKKIEIRRQIFHCVVGILFVAFLGVVESLEVIDGLVSRFPLNSIYFLLPLTRFLLLFLIVGIILILSCRKYKIPGITQLLENFERPHVRRRFPGKGAFFYVLGAFILALFFERIEVILASLLILSLGDSTSHIVGKEFGRIKHPFSDSKNIEGHITGALLGGLGASFFVPPPIAFSAAFVSMFVEGISFGGKIDWILDDNLVIPTVSGTIIVLLEVIFP